MFGAVETQDRAAAYDVLEDAVGVTGTGGFVDYEWDPREAASGPERPIAALEQQVDWPVTSAIIPS